MTKEKAPESSENGSSDLSSRRVDYEGMDNCAKRISPGMRAASAVTAGLMTAFTLTGCVGAGYTLKDVSDQTRIPMKSGTQIDGKLVSSASSVPQLPGYEFSPSGMYLANSTGANQAMVRYEDSKGNLTSYFGKAGDANNAIKKLKGEGYILSQDGSWHTPEGSVPARPAESESLEVAVAKAKFPKLPEPVPAPKPRKERDKGMPITGNGSASKNGFNGALSYEVPLEGITGEVPGTNSEDTNDDLGKRLTKYPANAIDCFRSVGSQKRQARRDGERQDDEFTTKFNSTETVGSLLAGVWRAASYLPFRAVSLLAGGRKTALGRGIENANRKGLTPALDYTAIAAIAELEDIIIPENEGVEHTEWWHHFRKVPVVGYVMKRPITHQDIKTVDGTVDTDVVKEEGNSNNAWHNAGKLVRSSALFLGFGGGGSGGQPVEEGKKEEKKENGGGEEDPRPTDDIDLGDEGGPVAE